MPERYGRRARRPRAHDIGGRRNRLVRKDFVRAPRPKTCARCRIGCARRGRALFELSGLPCVPARGPGVWQIGRGDMADAFVICWQFCLRFGSEVVGLNAPGHSAVSLHVDEGKHQVQVQFRQRKGRVAPDPAGRARARGGARPGLPASRGLEGMRMPAPGQTIVCGLHHSAFAPARRAAPAGRLLRGRAGLRQARRCPPRAP